MKRVLAFGLLLLLAVLPLSSWPAQAESREDAFRNFSTAPNYIKIQIEDLESGQRRWIVFESMQFSILLIDQWSNFVGKDMPRTKETYTAFIRQRVEELPIEMSLSAFADILAKQFGSEDEARKYLERYSFERPYSLGELGFTSEAELIHAYFGFDQKHGRGQTSPDGERRVPVSVGDPRFIALLLDLGYNVGRGDIAPMIFIEKTSSP